MHALTKIQFVAALDAAAITDTQKNRLHAALERDHPKGHQALLEWLGIAPAEIEAIRQRSRE